MKIEARFMGKSGHNFEGIDVSDCFDIIFGDSSVATGAIRIFMRDGWVEISAAEGRLELQPGAANLIRLRTPESK